MSKDLLSSHFTELRQRLLKSFLSFIPAFILGWFLAPRILNFLKEPIKPFLKHSGGELVFTAPVDGLLAYLQVAVFSGFFLSSPYWLAQIWLFVSPGLYKKEKKYFF